MTTRPTDGGSASIELVILAPVLLVLVALAIAAGRLTAAHTGVEHAAAVAARQASLARTADAARVSATAVATNDLAQQGITCHPLKITLSTTGFITTVGQPAQVRARISCRVTLADLSVPGMPGAAVITGDGVSVLDTWRGRT